MSVLQQGYGGRCLGGSLHDVPGTQPRGCYRNVDTGFYANGSRARTARCSRPTCRTSAARPTSTRSKSATRTAPTKGRAAIPHCGGNVVTPPPPPPPAHQPLGCYRVGPAGLYANGAGRTRATLLDVDLPGVCGIAEAAFASLPARANSGTDVERRRVPRPPRHRLLPNQRAAATTRGAGRYCALLDVDMPTFCGTTDFYSLPAAATTQATSSGTRTAATAAADRAAAERAVARCGVDHPARRLRRDRDALFAPRASGARPSPFSRGARAGSTAPRS